MNTTLDQCLRTGDDCEMGHEYGLMLRTTIPLAIYCRPAIFGPNLRRESAVVFGTMTIESVWKHPDVLVNGLGWRKTNAFRPVGYLPLPRLGWQFV